MGEAHRWHSVEFHFFLFLKKAANVFSFLDESSHACSQNMINFLKIRMTYSVTSLLFFFWSTKIFCQKIAKNIYKREAELEVLYLNSK